MKLNITLPAELDIQDILKDGYDDYGEEQAKNYVQNIYKKLQLLIRFPNLGHWRPDIPDTHQAVRVEENHIAIYRVEADTLHIVRILYSGFDFTQQDMH